MKRFNVLNVEPIGYSEQAKEVIREIASYKDGSPEQLDNSEALKKIDALIVRFNRKIDRKVLANAPGLKFVVSATTGLDHIDLKEAKRHKITVLSLKDEREFLETITSTSEHTWALLLSLVRNIPHAHEDVKKGFWRRDLFRGHQLRGKNIGIIGLGRTGRRVAEYALAFRMNIGFFDPNITDCKDDYIQFEKIEQLLAWADIISIHIPLNEETTGLLKKNNLKFMKKGAFLINTSRGAVVDEKYLVTLLKRNKLKGVATDVLRNELADEKKEKNPLVKSASEGYNVIITPHIAGATYEAMKECEIFMAKKLVAQLKRFP